jgi:citrate synthase
MPRIEGERAMPAQKETAMINGLDDVVVAETVLSDVDGQAGRLVIRGHSLDDLVSHATYEGVLGILWDGFLEDLPKHEELPAHLGAARQSVFGHLKAVDAKLLQQPLFDAVRALVARIRDGDMSEGDGSSSVDLKGGSVGDRFSDGGGRGGRDIDIALMLVAAPAVFTPGILRLRQGLAPVPPDPTLGHASDILRMLHGEPATSERAAALDHYLITASDHGLNASTFVARIVASTRAGLTSATVAAMSALKGPLHGGAPGPVLDMLDEIGSADGASSWLEDALARGDRLMGFGHRVYRVRDPRADALKEAVQHLARTGQVDPNRLRLAEAVEAAALDLLTRKKPNRSLQTNTEFYTALLLEAVGLPREAFTCIFAAGRAAGWIAHAREQALNGRLIRPQSRYVAPQPQSQALSAGRSRQRA